MKEKYHLTEWQEKYIVDHYYDMTSKQIAEAIGCNKSKVTNTWAKHGLSGKMHRKYPIVNENMFSKIDNPTSAYYLGLIASDGCIHIHKDNGCKIIKLSLQKTDEDILHRFAKDLGTQRKVTYQGGKYANFEITSPQIFDDLVRLGLNERKTYKNTVPYIDTSLMKYFIRGYFDGDGSITSHFDQSKKVNIGISGYENNLLKIKEYLDGINIFSSFTIDNRKYGDGNGRFGNLQISNVISRYCFCKHIYENDDYPAMKRKKDTCNRYVQLIENNIDINKYKMATIYYKYAVQKVS